MASIVGFAIYPKHGKFAAGQDFYVLSCIASFTVPSARGGLLYSSKSIRHIRVSSVELQNVQVSDTTAA